MVKITSCFWCGSGNLKKVATRKDGVGVQECQNCKLMLVDKRPADLSEYYDKKSYFNPEEDAKTGYHENYDLISPFYLYWQGAIIDEIVRYGHKKSLLEVGCATGNALEMMKTFNKNLKVHGIDLSPYAIKICLEKGLSASVSKIDDYKSKEKFDIIFSSETMEHVDKLSAFVEGVKANLSKDGVYIFYVPAVDREDLIREGENYPSLTTSLEHVSYFTDSFLENALSDSFKAPVYIHRMSASGENYHLGLVSADKKLTEHLIKFIEGFESYDESQNENKTLYNLTVVTAKFARFPLSDKYLQDLKNKQAPDEDVYFLEGMISYAKGELIKSKDYFRKFLGDSLVDDFMLKILLSIERDLTQILTNENININATNTEIGKRLFATESEVEDLKQSKIVGTSIKVRALTGMTLDPIRNLRARTKSKVINLIPRKLKYVIKLKWLVAKKEVDNQKYPESQPLVSVIIPYYNKALTINETIISLRAQTFKNFEVIIIDDGSTEEQSANTLKKINNKDLRLTVIQQKNQGVASARNNGISKAQGKYIICLDADDILDPTYIEKCLVVLETDPNADIATTDMRIFGVDNLLYKQGHYNALHLIDNNMVITAAMFTRDGWSEVGGYKRDIGYEDWEFWINLAEKGHWGKNIPEALFNYRTALDSRYIDDKKKHKLNIALIKSLHPKYIKIIRKIKRKNYFSAKRITSNSLFINLDRQADYRSNHNNGVLIAIPWMTFGGAETLIYNFCNEISNDFKISFITGLQSDHQWEYKFKEISNEIYHLPNLFSEKKLYVNFISNYITTRNIKILHIIHTDFVYWMIPELKRRHPHIKIIVTMFNNRVEHFSRAIDESKYVDIFSTDNNIVANDYKKLLPDKSDINVIPNGVDSNNKYNPMIFDRYKERESLGVDQKDIAIFFIGRLSTEKNPDVFLQAAKKVLSNQSLNSNIKFFIIGDGPMKNEIERSLKTINNTSIRYLGYQSNVAKYLSTSDIFVLPSSIEGFPLSILEAMAMKAVVIASDVGDVSDVIESGEDGIVVKPGSAKEIATWIEKLRSDPKLMQYIKDNARNTVEKKYSNKSLGDNYRQMYRSLLK